MNESELSVEEVRQLTEVFKLLDRYAPDFEETSATDDPSTWLELFIERLRPAWEAAHPAHVEPLLLGVRHRQPIEDQHLGDIPELEARSRHIQLFEHSAIPGLLQTEEYATAIDKESPNVREARLRHMITLRMARQRRFWESAGDPDRLWVVVDEWALRRVVGSFSIMHKQLMHVLESFAKCQLQVVPSSAQSYPDGLGAFIIFNHLSPEGESSAMAYVEDRTEVFYVDDVEERRRLVRGFELMANLALSPLESLRLVQKVAGEFARASAASSSSLSSRQRSAG